MKDCIVTQYVDGADNDNLPIYGAFKFKIVGNNEMYLTNNEQNKTFDFEIIGDGHFCSDNTYSDDLGKTRTSKTVHIATSTSCILVVHDNYDFGVNSMAYGVEGDMSFLNYRDYSFLSIKVTQNTEGIITSIPTVCTVFFILVDGNYKNNKLKFDLELFEDNTVIEKIAGRDGIAHGSISHLSNCTALKQIICQRANVTGDISALSNLTALTNIQAYDNDIEGNISALNNILGLTLCAMGISNIEGSVDELLENWWRAGKRNNCTIGFHTSQCTFLGNGLTVDYIAKFTNAGITVRNIADTQTIATYDGTNWTTA